MVCWMVVCHYVVWVAEAVAVASDSALEVATSKTTTLVTSNSSNSESKVMFTIQS